MSVFLDRLTDRCRFAQVELVEDFDEQIRSFDSNDGEKNPLAQIPNGLQSRLSCSKLVPDLFWNGHTRKLGFQECRPIDKGEIE